MLSAKFQMKRENCDMYEYREVSDALLRPQTQLCERVANWAVFNGAMRDLRPELLPDSDDYPGVRIFKELTKTIE